MKSEMDCKTMQGAMPDLLFDPGAASAQARAHVASCTACQGEMKALKRTMQVLGGWEAPEPTPYWTARMGARLREEQRTPTHGWAGLKQRLRTRFLLSNYSLRPAAGVAALGLVLAVSGGTWLDLALQQPPPVRASNTVQDLQSLNENAQVFQQFSTLDAPDSGSETEN
jgi:hypothetical protein